MNVFFLNPWSWHKAEDFALTNEWQTYSHSAVADTLGEFRKTMFLRMDIMNNGTVLIDDVKLSFDRQEGEGLPAHWGREGWTATEGVPWLWAEHLEFQILDWLEVLGIA